MIASLLALAFFLDSVVHLWAFFAAAVSRSLCLVVVRLAAEAVSTPMSTPLLATSIGMPLFRRAFAVLRAAAELGTMTLLPEWTS